MIKVVNVRNHVMGKFSVYIGRSKPNPSPLGNPFSVNKYGREKCIELYHNWLRKQYHYGGEAKDELLRLVDLYREYGELYLVCHCAPKACHGDVVKKAIIGIMSL